LLEEISFDAADLSTNREKISINAEFVQEQLGDLAKDEDLTRFIL